MIWESPIVIADFDIIIFGGRVYQSNYNVVGWCGLLILSPANKQGLF